MITYGLSLAVLSLSLGSVFFQRWRKGAWLAAPVFAFGYLLSYQIVEMVAEVNGMYQYNATMWLIYLNIVIDVVFAGIMANFDLRAKYGVAWYALLLSSCFGAICALEHMFYPAIRDFRDMYGAIELLCAAMILTGGCFGDPGGGRVVDFRAMFNWFHPGNLLGLSPAKEEVE